MIATHPATWRRRPATPVGRPPDAATHPGADRSGVSSPPPPPSADGRSPSLGARTRNRITNVLRHVLGPARLAGLRRENTRLRHQLRVLRRELARERHAARHDPLTGLPNRRQLAAAGPAAAALMIDLDRFKELNDHIGHGAGDDILLAVARRLAHRLGGDWLPVRLGGDEFAAIRSGSPDQPTLAAEANALAQALAQPIPVDGRTLRVGCSIGLAVSSRPVPVPVLLGRADTALAVAKERSRRPVAAPAGGNRAAGQRAARPAPRTRDLPHTGRGDVSMLVVMTDGDPARPERVVARATVPRVAQPAVAPGDTTRTAHTCDGAESRYPARPSSRERGGWLAAALDDRSGRGGDGPVVLATGELVGQSPFLAVGRVVLAAISGAVLLMAGCTTASEPDGGATPSPTQVRAPSPTAEDPVAAARSAALAAYAGMWRAYDQAGQAPAADPDDPRLADFATGDALANLMTALGRLRDRGLVFEGSYELTSPEVIELSPANAPTTAKIEDCQDSSEWRVVRADGGDYKDDPGGRQAAFVGVVLDNDGVWLVSGFAVREVGTC